MSGVDTSCTGHYYVLSGVGTLTTSSHLIQSIARLTFLTEHGSQVFFCGANDQQRSPNISPPSKASSKPSLIITKHGELCILSRYDVHAKRERYSLKLRALLFNFMFEVIVKL